MLVDTLKGKTVQQLASLIEDFQDLLSNSSDAALRERLGQIVALEGVKNFPVRMRCALIAYEALSRILKKL